MPRVVARALLKVEPLVWSMAAKMAVKMAVSKGLQKAVLWVDSTAGLMVALMASTMVARRGWL